MLYVMLQSGDILYPVFSSWMEFLLGICHILNLTTTIVLKECILRLNMVVFFSGSGLLLNIRNLIMTISQRILLSIESDSKNREISGITLWKMMIPSGNS